MKSNISPIGTDAAYKNALAKIERLWGAKRGTSKGDRLDVLATLIDIYETEHHPMDKPGRPHRNVIKRLFAFIARHERSRSAASNPL